MAFDIYGESDVGCVREANEDSIDWHIADDRFALAVVADGMGGYKGGEIASRTAVEIVKAACLATLRSYGEITQERVESCLLEAGAEANTNILQQRQQSNELSRMGTTLVIALAYAGQLTLLHAGDSRCYWVSGGGLKALTHDHSMVQQMLDEGAIDEEDIETFPYKNMLTKAVGVEKDLAYSVNTMVTEPGQQFLLCSDGLFNALSEEKIHDILQASNQIDQQVHTLIKESLSQQASDNVSAILLNV